MRTRETSEGQVVAPSPKCFPPLWADVPFRKPPAFVAMTESSNGLVSQDNIFKASIRPI